MMLWTFFNMNKRFSTIYLREGLLSHSVSYQTVFPSSFQFIFLTVYKKSVRIWHIASLYKLFLYINLKMLIIFSLSSNTWFFKLTYQDLHLVVSYQETVFPHHWGKENLPEVDCYSVLDAAEVSWMKKEKRGEKA